MVQGVLAEGPLFLITLAIDFHTLFKDGSSEALVIYIYFQFNEVVLSLLRLGFKVVCGR